MKNNLTSENIQEQFQFSLTNLNQNEISYILNRNYINTSSIPYLHATVSAKFALPISGTSKKVPFFLLLYVASGTGSFLCSTLERPIEKDTLILLPPDTPFTFHTTSKVFEVNLFYFSGEPLTYYYQELNRHSEVIYLIKNKCNEFIRLSVIQMRNLLEDNILNSDIQIFKYFSDIVADMLFSRNSGVNLSDFPTHVQKLKHILDHEYTQLHTLDTLAERLNINKYRLCRDFSNALNISPVQYLNKVRMSAASMLLEETDLLIHEVGEQVGIENTTHFINLFKRATGFTPLQFREYRTHSLLYT